MLLSNLFFLLWQDVELVLVGVVNNRLLNGIFEFFGRLFFRLFFRPNFRPNFRLKF